ncbi:hypothetical protein NKI59_04785 [Mesorhizobium sp. M0598]|uniref:hypothetical protein n=1 Tax=Mesorhizobium sp. M0598 TaxID=2956968 RepID=UPI00333846F6
MNLSSSAAKGRAVLTRTWNRIRFWCSFPFARLGFWLRERKRYNAMFPRRWLSPAQIIDHDLELVDDDDVGKLDRSLLDLLVARRDHLKSSSGKFTILNISLFTFLVANYFHLGTDVSVYGISIKSSPGVAESLLAISSTLGIYAATLQANIAIVDGAIAHLLKRIFPRGILNVMKSALIPETAIGKYFPSNIPHLVFTGFHSAASKYFVYCYLMLLIVIIACVYAISMLLMKEIWIASSLGVYSKIIVVYVFICGIFGAMFLLLTRFPSPYRDYSVFHKMQIAEQLWPDQASDLRQQLYGAKIEDRADLERRGYIKPYKMPEGA